MTDPRLVDMEPGGESTQYESIREFIQPPEKQTGQLGGGQPHTKSEMKTTFDKKGNGNGNGPNGEEYAQAQKLGMGQDAQGKNKGI